MKLFLVIGPHHWRKHERNYQSAVVDKSLDGHLARRLLNSRETIMCEGWLSGVDTNFSVQECQSSGDYKFSVDLWTERYGILWMEKTARKVST